MTSCGGGHTFRSAIPVRRRARIGVAGHHSCGPIPRVVAVAAGVRRIHVPRGGAVAVRRQTAVAVHAALRRDPGRGRRPLVRQGSNRGGHRGLGTTDRDRSRVRKRVSAGLRTEPGERCASSDRPCCATRGCVWSRLGARHRCSTVPQRRPRLVARTLFDAACAGRHRVVGLVARLGRDLIAAGRGVVGSQAARRVAARCRARFVRWAMSSGSSSLGNVGGRTPTGSMIVPSCRIV